MKTTASKSKKTNGAVKKATGNAGKAEHDGMLREFFVDEIKDIYWAEKHLVKTLPKMAKAATSDELKGAISKHLEVTKTHDTRLEQ